MKSILLAACMLSSMTIANANTTDSDEFKDNAEKHKPVTPQDLLQVWSPSIAMINEELTSASKHTVPLAFLDGAEFSYYGEQEQQVEYTHDASLSDGTHVATPGFYIVGTVEVDETGRYTIPQKPKHLRKSFLYLYSATNNSSAYFDAKKNGEVVEFINESLASAETLAETNHLGLECYMDCPQEKDTEFATSNDSLAIMKSPVDWPHELAAKKQEVLFPLIAAVPTPESSNNEDREHLYPIFATI